MAIVFGIEVVYLGLEKRDLETLRRDLLIEHRASLFHLPDSGKLRRQNQRLARLQFFLRLIVIKFHQKPYFIPCLATEKTLENAMKLNSLTVKTCT